MNEATKKIAESFQCKYTVFENPKYDFDNRKKTKAERGIYK